MLGIKHSASVIAVGTTAGLTSRQWTKRLALFSIVIWGLGFLNGFEFSLAILFAVGFFLAIAGLRYPLLGLLAVGILSTLDAPARHYLLSGGLFRWNSFNYWLAIVTILHVPFLLRLRNGQARLLEFFAGWMLLQLLITPDLTNGVLHVLNFSAIFGLSIYFVKALEQEREVLHWVGILNGIVAAMGGLVFFTQLQELSYINPNAFSHFPLMGLSSAAIALSLKGDEDKNSDDPLLFLLVAVNFVWVFLSASRGGLLLAVFVIVLLLLRYNPFADSPRYVIFAAFGLVISLGIASQFSNLQEHTLERLEKAFDTSLSLKSRTSGRSELAKGGLAVFQDHPFGVGTGGFSMAWTQLDAEAVRLEISNRSAKAAHSGWIKVLAENGLMGIVSFTAYTASFFLLGWQRRKEGLLLVAALAGTFITVNMNSSEFQSKAMWYLAAGAMVLLHLDEMLHDWKDALERRPVDLFRSWHVH